MSNVIRPTFGAPSTARTAAEPSSTVSADAGRQPRLYGQAAGYRVGLLRDEEGPEGRTHRVVVGALETNEIEAVAVVPATRDGEVDAERIAMAILRTLEIVEERGSSRA